MDDETPYSLPLFPLGTVLFPRTLLPLRVFEPRYVDLIGRCMRNGAGFGVVAIKSGRETGVPAEPFDTGTVARIIDFDQGTDGLLHIVIRGNERVRISDFTAESDNLLVAQAVRLPSVADGPIPDDFTGLSRLLTQIETSASVESNSSDTPSTAAELAYRLSQLLPLSLQDKVELLRMDSAIAILSRLSQTLGRLQAVAGSS